MSKLIYDEVIEHFTQMETGDITEIKDRLRSLIEESDAKLVVLDDDPTGVQAVHDVCVYTDWTEDCFAQGFMRPERVFYILTNSRAMTETETLQVHREIAKNLSSAAQKLHQKYVLISRSDSTLRGHFPLETETLKESLEELGSACFDGEILIPYFHAGGRFTINNTHYVKDGMELIPAGETEFARDRTFGYLSSNLCDYIEEKTQGRYSAEQVTAIGLDSLRKNDTETITKQLLCIEHFNKVIVNVISERDLMVFCIALLQAMKQGKNYMFRTAADFVKVFGDISSRCLLSREEMITGESKHGGIVVVGSHTAKTTYQLEALKGMKELIFIPFQSDLVLEDKLENEVARVVKESEDYIADGKTVVIYTNRKLLTLANDTKEQALLRSVRISEAVCQLVGDLKVEPTFVVAKGGITSSDIGVKALRVKEAYVLGQIQPGIPVWKTDEQSKFPGIPYVIFPGNVGDVDSLRKVVETLL